MKTQKIQVSRRRRGFTLVELLVVISIIIVLAGLAFVGSQKVLRGAKSASAVSNLREINTALINAGNEDINNGHHRPGNYPPVAGHEQSPFRSFTWWDLIGKSQGWAKLEGGTYEWNTNPADTFLGNPLSDLTLGGKGGDFGKLYNTPENAGGSFGLNYAVSAWAAHHSPNPATTRIGQVPYPESTILVAETADGWNAAHFPPYNPNAIGGAYNDRTHVLMVAGNVEIINDNILKSTAGRDFYAVLDGPGKVRPPN